MRKRPEMEDVKDVIKINEDIFNIRLKLAKLKKSPQFTLKN